MLLLEVFSEHLYSLVEVFICLKEVLCHDKQIIVANLLKKHFDSLPKVVLHAKQCQLQFAVFLWTMLWNNLNDVIYSSDSVVFIVNMPIPYLQVLVYWIILWLDINNKKPSSREICFIIIYFWHKYASILNELAWRIFYAIQIRFSIS